jgi:hypothetical protein
MTATLNGRTCTHVELDVPQYGVWRAKVELDGADALTTAPGGGRLEVSGLLGVCTVVAQGDRAGRRGAELVGGFAGWAKPAPVRTATQPSAARADNGVSLARWAAQLGEDVGERVVALPGVDRPIGITVPRLGGERACDVLSQACALPHGQPIVPWWVRLSDGATVLGARAGTAVDAIAVDAGPADEWRSYALVGASPLLPGGMVDGRTIRHLHLVATGQDATQRVSLEPLDTFWSALRRAVLSVVGPRVSALRLYRYQVIGIEGDGRLRAQPRAKSLAPVLDGLSLWPGLAGHRARPRVGSDILVQFADGDPGQPIVVGFQSAVRGGPGIPEISEIVADRLNFCDAQEPVARRTDGVDVGTISITAGVPPPIPSGLGAVLVTYTPPSGTPNTWMLAGPSLVVTTSPPSSPSVDVRGEIDDVGQGKVYA